MKNRIVAVLIGFVFGLLLMVGVFFVLNLKTTSGDQVVQNEINIEKPIIDTIEKTETEKIEEGVWPPGLTLPMKGVEEETEEETEEPDDSQNSAPVVNNQLPYYIRVNRLSNCVTVYTYDGNGAYTVPVKAMVCSVGTDWSTPLGVSKISDKYVWRLLFGNTYGHYSVRFNGHILFHSVPYMKQSNDTLKEGQFNLLGEPASQGCIRLCVADAKWIYDNCPKGTLVEVYDSEDPGPLGKPSMPTISLESPYRGWDPTDPNPANPWQSGVVAIYGAIDRVYKTGDSIDVLEGVSAVDVDGLALTIEVSGTVNANEPGVYTVTYSTTGVLGGTATQTVTFTVQDSSQSVSENEKSDNTESPDVEETESETQGSEQEESSTHEEETQEPETQEPESQEPETQEPEAQESETQEPESQEPETQEPEPQESETQESEPQEPETQVSESEEPETQDIDTEETEIQESETVESETEF